MCDPVENAGAGDLARNVSPTLQALRVSNVHTPDLVLHLATAVPLLRRLKHLDVWLKIESYPEDTEGEFERLQELVAMYCPSIAGTSRIGVYIYIYIYIYI